jgi:hypothetical protein
MTQGDQTWAQLSTDYRVALGWQLTAFLDLNAALAPDAGAAPTRAQIERWQQANAAVAALEARIAAFLGGPASG